MADALTETALEDMAVSVKAAESALDEAIAANDAPAIAAATARLRMLQGSGAGETAVDMSGLPGSDVERELSEALEKAALDEGEDADDLGLLEDLPTADLAIRVEAARASNGLLVCQVKCVACS